MNRFKNTKFDENNNKTHYKDSNGYEHWYEYDENNELKQLGEK